MTFQHAQFLFYVVLTKKYSLVKGKAGIYYGSKLVVVIEEVGYIIIYFLFPNESDFHSSRLIF